MLGVRIEPDLERELERLARHSGRTKSEVARDAIRRYVQEHGLAQEARRQSLLASQTSQDEELPDFDDTGWTA